MYRGTGIGGGARPGQHDSSAKGSLAEYSLALASFKILPKILPNNTYLQAKPLLFLLPFLSKSVNLLKICRCGVK